MSSTPQRRGLGRGLGSLIPTAPPRPEEGSDVHEHGRATALAASTTTVTAAPRPEVAAPRSPADDAPADSSATVEESAVATEKSGRHVADLATPDAPGAEPEGSGEVAGAWFAELPLDQVRPNPQQPRQVFGEEAMAELVASITEVGLLQPVVVRPLARTETGADDGVRYELVMGERRWRASQAAGLRTLPAIVRHTADVDLLRDALLENLHRAELNPLEEASAYAQLLEDFGCTHEELASRLGRSRPQISNMLRLLRLSPAVQRRVAAGVLSAGHARALLAVDDADRQDHLAQRVVAEGISVRSLEELVAVDRDAGGDEEAPRARRGRVQAPGLSEIADRLSDRFDTRVKVDLGRNKGRITVEFATLSDLSRIIDIMDPRNRFDRPI